MESVDTMNRQSGGLPSITHFDSDRIIKREEVDYPRFSSAVTSPARTYAAPSQSHGNHFSPVNPSVARSPTLHKASNHDGEQRQPVVRQSLPSIHEALAVEPPAPYVPANVAASRASVAPVYPPTTSTNTSPLDQRPRPPPIDIRPAPASAHPQSPFVGSAPYAAAPVSAPAHGDLSSGPSHSANHATNKLPSLHPLKTTRSPPLSSIAPRPSSTYSYPPHPAHAEVTAPPQSAPQHYAYPPATSTYSQPTPSHTAYQPTHAPYSEPPHEVHPPAWRDGYKVGRADPRKLNRASLTPYGESVKRHLESFDLEASLNEMADGSGRIAEFSKYYRQRAHDNQRIGMTPQSMPRLEEVDSMLKQSERIQMSLHRMRDVVFNHHQASIADSPQEAHYRSLNGYEHESASNYGDEAKGSGGFAGGDNKTRKRGRAAPPGRCHSCNRAETPEWRRGPDGARTLCNACGLHYAKLTRKMGGKQAMASSNLRPKSLDDSSPPA